MSRRLSPKLLSSINSVVLVVVVVVVFVVVFVFVVVLVVDGVVGARTPKETDALRYRKVSDANSLFSVSRYVYV